MNDLRRDKVNTTVHFLSKGIWTDFDFWQINSRLLQTCNIVSHIQVFLGMKHKKVTFFKT